MECIFIFHDYFFLKELIDPQFWQRPWGSEVVIESIPRGIEEWKKVRDLEEWGTKSMNLFFIHLCCKQEQSGGTADWPPKLQTTNLVGQFGPPAGCWIPWNKIFILCTNNSPNLPCYITWRVYIIESQSRVPPLCSSLSLVFFWQFCYKDV